MSLHGRFFPKFPSKYAGDPTNIVFRSAWERTFMEYCDRRADIIKWSSEELIVPYYFPGDRKWHRYFPDFLLNLITKTGEHQTWLVEIKPVRQTRKPLAVSAKSKRPQLREAIEYARNVSKWQAAEAFCAAKGWKFVILTEKDLYPRA